LTSPIEYITYKGGLGILDGVKKGFSPVLYCVMQMIAVLVFWAAQRKKQQLFNPSACPIAPASREASWIGCNIASLGKPLRIWHV
jgi:hypothetical protein